MSDKEFIDALYRAIETEFNDYLGDEEADGRSIRFYTRLMNMIEDHKGETVCTS